MATPEIHDEIEKGLAEAERAEQRRLSQEEARKRQESRTAYQDLTPEEAQELAATTFPRLFSRPSWEEFDLRDESRVVAYDGAQGAIVSDSPTVERPSSPSELRELLADRSGDQTAVLGNLPLRARNESGRLAPLDADLEQSGDHYEAANPSAEAHLPIELSDGVELPAAGVAMTPGGAAGAADGERLGIDKVFYANSDTDTDFFASPTQLGAEAFWQLRSERSPQELKLKMDLPPGAVLETGPNGWGAEITRDSTTLASVSEPLAFDADGTAVPVSMGVEGANLRLLVEHRAGDWKYPIQLDPVLRDEWHWWSAGMPCPSHSGFPRWRWEPSGSSYFSPGCNNTLGITNNAPGQGRWYAQNSYAQWVYSPPPNSYIGQADLFGASLSSSAPDNVCSYGGIWSAQAYAWEHRTYPPPCSPYSGANWTFYGSHDNNAVVSQLFFPGTNPRQKNSWTNVPFVRVWVGDRHSPVITSGPRPASGWTDDSLSGGGTQQYTYTASATDLGLGVQHFWLVHPNLSTPADPTAAGASRSCGEGLTDCISPTSWSTPINYKLPEGRNSVGVVAFDQLDNTGNENTSDQVVNWWQPIDRTPPALTEISGSLKDPQVSGRELRVKATDGSRGDGASTWANNATARSGVRSVAYYARRAGSPVWELVSRKTWPDCPHVLASCERQRDFTLPARYPPGTYEFKVEAKDYLGHPRESQVWTDTVGSSAQPPLEPERLGLEHFWHYDDLDTGAGTTANVNLATGNLVWHSMPVENPGRGLATVGNLTYNSHDAPPLGDLLLESRFLGLDYDEVGRGFSLGISGLTRVNEPLGGVLVPALRGAPGNVTLTDADGTLHEFKPDTTAEPAPGPNGPACLTGVPLAYEAPPGVHLRLRRFRCLDQDLAQLIENTLELEKVTAEELMDLRLDSLLPGDDPGEPQRTFAELSQLTHSQVRRLVEGLYVLERKDHWAITRADGVTFYFNGFGFATSIKDRDGNEISFEYEKVNPLGQPCQPVQLGSGPNDVFPNSQSPPEPPILPPLCEPRLKRVVDPAGSASQSQQVRDARSVELDYYDLADYGVTGPQVPQLETSPNGVLLDVPTNLKKVQTLVDQTTAALGGLPQAATKLASLNKVQAIEDHGDRRLEFVYDDQGGLVEFREATGTSAARQTGFAYDQGFLGGLLEHPQMTEITDPEGEKTRIAYKPGQALDPRRPVDWISDRNPDPTASGVAPPDSHRFSYSQGSNGEQTTEVTGAKRDPQSLAAAPVTRVLLDELDRPLQITEAQGQANERTTTLSWNDDNLLESLDEPATTEPTTGTPTTTYTYNDNGLPLSVTDETAEGETRTTEFTYCDHPGTQRSQVVDESDDGFVSDLLRVRRPEGASWRYELDELARPNEDADEDGTYCQTLKSRNLAAQGNVPLRGRVTAEIDPLGERARTEYDAATGVVTAEVDREGGRTEYSHHDRNGLPQKLVDPEGERWIYAYDEVGNTLTITDPRGPSSVDPGEIPAASTPFTTTLVYDALDRLICERVPRDSAGAAGEPIPCTSQPSGAFADRKYIYDDNDNTTAAVDALGNQTDLTYTEMDLLEEEKTPAVPVKRLAGSAIDSSTERLVTSYRYDGEEDLIGVRSPEGNAQAGGYELEYRLDSLGRPVAEVQVASPGDDLVTSFAYDARDNLRRVIDPRRNATRTVQQAITAAEQGANPRMVYEYDLANQLVAEIEDPGSGRLNLRTQYAYDKNGNQEEVRYPRFFEGCATCKSITDFDDRDLPVSETDPAGGVRTYDYDADGRLIAEISPRADETTNQEDFTTRYEYDDRGDLIARTLPWRAGQYGLTDATLKSFKIEYTRNAVGDPWKIQDAVGNLAEYRQDTALANQHTFTNAFFDTGELRTTQRPGWWRLNWGESPITPDPGVRFAAAGGGAQSDPALAQGGPVLEERDLAGTAAPKPQSSSASEPASPGDLGRVAPEQIPDFLPAAGQTSFDYDREMRLTEVEHQGEAQQSADDATFAIDYDAIGRVTSREVPLTGATTIERSYGYDANSNPTQFVDGRSNQWSFAYDQFDRVTTERAPGAVMTQAATSDEITEFKYDPNSNLRERITPRCVGDVAGCSVAGRYAFRFAYDEVDRLVSETNPVAAPGNPNAETWSYKYDADGNRTEEVSPRGNATGAAGDFTTETAHDGMGRPKLITDPLGAETEITYDAAGNRIRTEEPGGTDPTASTHPARVTEITYDGRDLPWQRTTGVGAGASSGAGDGDFERTTVTEYDPNGNLRRRVNPAGVNSNGTPAAVDSGSNLEAATEHATLYEHDRDDLLKNTYLPWGHGGSTEQGVNLQAQNERRYRQERGYDSRGRLRSITYPYKIAGTGDPEPKADRVCYTHYDTGWIASSTDPLTVDLNGACTDPRVTVEYEYDKRGYQTLWRAVGDSKDREVRRSFFANGLLAEREAERTRNQGAQDPTEPPRTYTYEYNANRSLTEFVDESASPERHTLIGRDAAERERWVNEAWSSGRDTLQEFDPAGNVSERFTDGTLDRQSTPNDLSDDQLTGGTQASFQYDELEREERMEVDPAQAGEANRVTTTDYFPSGAPLKRDKAFSGVEETYSYARDGLLTRMERDDVAGGEGSSKDQQYAYDANGNRTKDERGTYVYNPRDQLVLWTRSSAQPDSGTDVVYEVNGSGATVNEIDGAGPDTEFNYTADRLESSTMIPENGGQAQLTEYQYNDFGSITCARLQEDECSDEASIVYRYDAFDRRIGSSEEEDVTYFYDGLDRRDRKEDGSQTEELSYIGTSELLTRETGSNSPNKFYDYDSSGARQGQLLVGSGGPEYRSYAKDGQGSVEALESRSGADLGSYDYDPYGQLVDPSPGSGGDAEEELDPDLRQNPFRFQGHYYDADVETYDMQARTYEPQIGRFLGQDQYEQASADLALQSDPLTQNRYVFAGGNPVSRIEFDGHLYGNADTQSPTEASRGESGGSPPSGPTPTTAEVNRAYNVSTANTTEVVNRATGNTVEIKAEAPALSAVPEEDIDRVVVGAVHATGCAVDGGTTLHTMPEACTDAQVAHIAEHAVRELSQGTAEGSFLGTADSLMRSGPEASRPSSGSLELWLAPVEAVAPIGSAIRGVRACIRLCDDVLGAGGAASSTARGGSAASRVGGSVDDVSRSAATLHSPGLSRAGHSLSKHQHRGGPYPSATGSPQAISRQAQDIVDEVLTNPASTFSTRQTGRFGEVVDIQIPGGPGLRYSEGQGFLHFLEPPR